MYNVTLCTQPLVGRVCINTLSRPLPALPNVIASTTRVGLLLITLSHNAPSLWGLISIKQSNNLYRAIVQRRVLQCSYAESKRNVLRRILNVLTDGAVRQFSGREFQSLGAATEKRRAASAITFNGLSGLYGGFCAGSRHLRFIIHPLVGSARLRRLRLVTCSARQSNPELHAA